MSAATAARSPFQTHGVSEESYCSPWDLKSQEEKFKLLSEQRSTSSSNTITALTDALLHPSNAANRSTSLSSSNINHNPFQRTRSARTTSSTKKSFTLRETSPPVLPPLPPGGLIPQPPPPSSSSSASTNVTCQCVGGSSNNNTRNRSLNNNNNNSINESLDPSLKKISYCLNAHAVRSGTDTSRSFVFASSPPSNERSQRVNTAPAKVDLSQTIENRQDSINLTSQSSTISSLSTTTSSSTESPSITDDTKPMSFEVGSFLIRDYLQRS